MTTCGRLSDSLLDFETSSIAGLEAYSAGLPLSYLTYVPHVMRYCSWFVILLPLKLHRNMFGDEIQRGIPSLHHLRHKYSFCHVMIDNGKVRSFELDSWSSKAIVK